MIKIATLEYQMWVVPPNPKLRSRDVKGTPILSHLYLKTNNLNFRKKKLFPTQSHKYIK